ncbi:MAG: VanZ family protein [Ruminococcaceae bacterium]|nr:VanZ family protein [Oscillospiraceae bacterium]
MLLNVLTNEYIYGIITVLLQIVQFGGNMSKIIDYILNMIPYMVIALPIIFLTRMIIVHVRGLSKRTTFLHETGIHLFFLYLVGLASQTIIPALEIRVHGIGIVNQGLKGEINLIPGKVFVDTWNECINNHYWMYFIINFLGNICIFIPIGFLICLLWQKQSLFKTAMIGFGISLFIEICQLPQARSTDIDDLWLNTSGSIIGFFIYKLSEKILKKTYDRFKLRRNA